MQCGCVLEDIAFSTDVAFQKDAAGESTVVGQFVNESGVARGIGRIHGGRVYAYQADSHERAQQRGRHDIAHLVDQLSIRPREETIESSHRLYKLALQRGFTRGRRTNQVAAACLYLVCRQDSKPFLLIDFSDALQVNVFTLGAVFLQLAKLLRLEEHPLFSKPVDPSLYIHRFADRMNFPSREVMNRVAGTAMRLVASMKRDWIQTGRRPSGVCGAALYIASHLHGYAKAKRDVVDVVHIGEHTLAKRLTEFTATEAGALTKKQFEEQDGLLESSQQQALEGATASAAPAGVLAGCEHMNMGAPHFKQGMCQTCWVDFVKTFGGTYDGANPPAFLRARQNENKKAVAAASGLLALPAPGDGDEEEEEEDNEHEDAGPGPSSSGGKSQKQRNSGGKKQVKGKRKGPSGDRPQGEDGDDGSAEDEEERNEEGEGAKESEVSESAKVTAAMIAAAEKKVEEFENAIAEAEAHDAKKNKRRRTMSASAAIAAATAMAVKEAAEGAGAGACDAEAAAGAIVPTSGGAVGQLPVTTAGDFGNNNVSSGIEGGEGEVQAAGASGGDLAVVAAADEIEEALDDGDGNLSEISESDIAMYIADEAEVACKEEIWNMMNQDWVEKQAAKKAAMEAAEKVQAEQRAAMEAAEAAGIQYKRGRGRPLGSKTKPRPDLDLPPADTPQEAAMRMLDNKKLSSKINYSALADLFSDEPEAPPPAFATAADGGTGAGPSGATTNTTSQPEPAATPNLESERPAPGRVVVPGSMGPPPDRLPLPPGSNTAMTHSTGSVETDGPPGGGSEEDVPPVKRPVQGRLAGLAPRGPGAAAAVGGVGVSRPSLGGLTGGIGATPTASTRLGGLNEGLRPIGASLSGMSTYGAGPGASSVQRSSAAKVRFKPGTKH